MQFSINTIYTSADGWVVLEGNTNGAFKGI
jgi:hypothetical protein